MGEDGPQQEKVSFQLWRREELLPQELLPQVPICPYRGCSCSTEDPALLKRGLSGGDQFTSKSTVFISLG